MGHIAELFNHYGYIVLFAALTLELIALPTPGETLMIYCGFLVFEGKFNWIISIIIAASGVICGITISYFIGSKLGTTFFEKYGSYIHIGPERLEKTSKWFKKYGNGLLAVAYFIPGIRHITGYFSGITRMPFKKFAMNAYIGAFIWTGTFISLGMVLGSNWEKFHGYVRKYLIIGGLIIGIIMIGVYTYKNYKHKIKEYIAKYLENLIKIFHSLGKIRIAMVGVAIVFITMFIFVIGLIQDFLANEFIQFDTIINLLVSSIFSQKWTFAMKFFRLATSPEALILLTILIFIWIVTKGKNRLLEIRFLFIAILGGEALEEVLRFVFHRLGPSGLSMISNIKYTFPSEQTLIATVAYGFAAFMIVRHAERKWLGSLAIIIGLFICIFSGLSALFFQLQYPSDVLAGYVFGGVWLSLNIILLEVFRILPEIKN